MYNVTLLMLPLLLGYVLDLLIGDPAWLYHPVRLIGKMIDFGEKLLRKCFPSGRNGEFWGGVVLTVLVPSISFSIPFLLLNVFYKYSFLGGMVLESFFCFQILAVHSLKKESMRVYDQLVRQDLPEARKYLSWIVGRDTQNLTEEEIVQGTVETVAENTSDGIGAPLLYMAIGGAPLGFFYKAVNTLDSMIGYRNDRFLYFGRAAARLDDVLNWIPARISALVMLVAGVVMKLNVKNGFTIYRRDRNNHKSPNSAHTEAACAGLMEIQLGGGAWYFGAYVEKPTIGTAKRAIEKEDIVRVNRLMLWTSTLLLILCLVLRAAFYLFLSGVTNH